MHSSQFRYIFSQYIYSSRKSQFRQQLAELEPNRPNSSLIQSSLLFDCIVDSRHNTHVYKFLISLPLEIMYIYPSSPESASSLQSEESAAIKIQAGFRGYRVRKQLYRLNKSGANSSSSSNRSKGRQSSSRPSALRRQQQQQQRAMEERLQQEGQQTADGQTVEDRCATKIQAGFRGFLVRKKQKIATDAAVKIQSSFRGFKARKEAEKLKQT